MRGWNLTAPERAIFDAIADDHQDGTMTDWAIAEEATGIARELERAGWQLVRTEALPDRAPARGPRTSDEAAESIDNLSARHYATWQALARIGPSTDEVLAEHYAKLSADYPDSFPPQTPQSLRTRRAELVRAGHVVATGATRPTSTGHAANVWRAVTG